MATDSGYSNQKKKGISQFETVQSLGSQKYGKAVSNKALYLITAAANIVSVTPILGSNGNIAFWNIQLTSHGASVDNVMRVVSNNNEFEIVQVIDANNFYVLPIIDTILTSGTSVEIMGWVTQKLSATGETSVSISTAPTQFNYNGTPQTVEQNTSTPANNRALPNLNFIIKDGVQVPVTKDTATPANTIPMPVEVSSIALPTGASTEAKQDAQITLIGALTETAPASDTASSGLNGRLQRIAQRLSSLIALLPTSLGQKTSAASLAVTVASDQTAIPASQSGTWNITNVSGTVSLPTGAATAANQSSELTLIGAVTETAPATDTASSGLNGRLQRIAQRLTSLIALFPATLGQKTMANSFAVVIASDQSSIPVAQGALTASYQEILNLTTVAQTITSPAGAKWVKVYADDTNTANIRLRMAGTATTTSGIQFQQGRSEDFSAVGASISVIAESGSNQKINFHFGA